MKKILIVFAALLLSTAMFALDGKKIYKKYSSNEDVSAVYISPALFRIIGKLPEIKISGSEVDLSKILSEFKGLYLINSENATVNEGMKADIESMLGKGKYELLIEAKDEGETVNVYTCGRDVITNFILSNTSESDCTFICIDGKIKRDDLESLLAKLR